MMLYNRLDEFPLLAEVGLEDLPLPSDISFIHGRNKQIAIVGLCWHTDEWYFEVEFTCDGNVFYKEAKKADPRWCYLLRYQFITRVKEKSQKLVSMVGKPDREFFLDRAREFIAGTKDSKPL